MENSRNSAMKKTEVNAKVSVNEEMNVISKDMNEQKVSSRWKRKKRQSYTFMQKNSTLIRSDGLLNLY